MIDKYSLTYTQAELYFLARVSRTESGDHTANIIARSPELADLLMASGVGGLLLRGKAELVEGTPELDLATKGVVSAFGSAELWIQLVLMAGERVVSYLIARTPHFSAILAPAGPGVYEVGMVEPEQSDTHVASALVSRFLQDESVTTVEAVVGNLVTANHTVLRKIDGGWSLVTPAPGDSESQEIGDGEIATELFATINASAVALSD